MDQKRPGLLESAIRKKDEKPQDEFHDELPRELALGPAAVSGAPLAHKKKEIKNRQETPRNRIYSVSQFAPDYTSFRALF
jgi:hypothetical protein